MTTGKHTEGKTAPVQDYGRIPWSTHVKAWREYHRQHPNHQTAERMAERGGFHVSEMDVFHPTWRDEVEEIPLLKTQRDALLAALEKIQSWTIPGGWSGLYLDLAPEIRIVADAAIQQARGEAKPKGETK